MSSRIVYKKVYNDIHDIIYSIVTPVYNQEDIIVDNLKSFIENTQDAFEIILILDFCFDNTERNIMEFLETYENKVDTFAQITIFKNDEKPLFETKCDNIGFKHSVGRFCLEIQADMKMTEYGYNLQLTKPFNILDTVIAISGRACLNFSHTIGIGKLDESIEKSISELNIDKNKFYIYETCIRGPLLIDRSKLKELNYLDEEEYYLDYSDCDLMYRAYLEKGYICGYVPIDFHSPISLGSTRNNKVYNCNEYLINKAEKERLQRECASKKGLSKYISVWKNRDSIMYDL